MTSKPRKVKAMKERRYLANRNKRMKFDTVKDENGEIRKLDTIKGKIVQCSRCHAEPVKTTEFELGDTYIDDDGKSVHLKANYCHRCLAIAYRRKESTEDEQEENRKGLEQQWVDSEGRIRPEDKAEAMARIRARRADMAEQALWDRKRGVIQILSPILRPKPIRRSETRQAKDKKIGQTRVQEI